MKRQFFTALLIGLVSMLAMSFTLSPPANPEKVGYGFRKAVTVTSSTAITLSPGNYTMTLATLAIAHDATVNATVTNSLVGDIIVLKVTADGTTRNLTFTGNITALADSVLANKTKLFEFVFDGSKFVQLSELQIN